MIDFSKRRYDTDNRSEDAPIIESYQYVQCKEDAERNVESCPSICDDFNEHREGR